MRIMYWFLVLFLNLTYGSVLEASHGKTLPSTVVVGTVYCDTCFQHAFSTRSHFISGASVAVECKVGNLVPSFNKEVKTNEHGEFKVEVPSKVWKHAKRIKGCTFKLISSSESYCSVASIATSSSVSLKTREQGKLIFSAGLFSFKPTKKPNFCNHKQSVPNSKAHMKNEFPPNTNPSALDQKSVEDTFFPFPPIPFLPPFPFPFPFPPFPFPPPTPTPTLPPTPLPTPLSPPPLPPVSPPLYTSPWPPLSPPPYTSPWPQLSPLSNIPNRV